MSQSSPFTKSFHFLFLVLFVLLLFSFALLRLVLQQLLFFSVRHSAEGNLEARDTCNSGASQPNDICAELLRRGERRLLLLHASLLSAFNTQASCVS